MHNKIKTKEVLKMVIKGKLLGKRYNTIQFRLMAQKRNCIVLYQEEDQDK